VGFVAIHMVTIYTFYAKLNKNLIRLCNYWQKIWFCDSRACQMGLAGKQASI